MKRHPLLILSLLLASLLGSFVHAQTPTMTFTVQTTTSAGTAVQPRLVWATTPAAASCVASGAIDWTGEKTASGAVTLASIRATTSYSLTCNWSGDSTARLTWVAPTTFTDGTPYTNPGGYRVTYGRSATLLDTSAYIQDPAARTWTSPTLAAGTWFFGIQAFGASGLESPAPPPPPIVSKVITAGGSQTRTLEVAVKYPSPPTGFTAD